MVKAGRVRWMVMFLVFLITTVSYLDRTNLSVSAPVITKELHITPIQLGVILSAFSWAYALAQIPAGFIAGWLRPRKTFLYGLLAWAIILILTTTATSYGAWIFFRIPFGIAEAITWPAASVLLSRWFPRVEYSQAMSLQNLGLVIGAAVSPPIVSFILIHWGWQVAFIITGLIAACLGIFFYLFVKDNPEEDKKVSAAELKWIQSDQVDISDDTPAPKGFFWKLTKLPTLWSIGIANFGLDFINFMFLTWYPSYLSEKYHMSLSKMGILGMEPYIFGLFTVLGAGAFVRRLVDRGMDSVKARKWVISSGLILGTIALFVASYVTNMYCSVTAMSLGYAFVMSILGPMWSAPAEIAGKKGAGYVSGFVNFIGNIGGILSPILMGFVLEKTGTFTPAVFTASGITLTCLILFLLLYHVKRDQEKMVQFHQSHKAASQPLAKHNH
ncbi:MFS transporter [Pullulanibacillus camelliae]|uniref:MFS transporter n=1 Tax=Pullulanibacillus camelliae TaxID=1707096 RepID=A0A8J3E0A0_9BACL|nr:MFS transporter [Pullulanibacillus camelliae]GGE53260.1 MFS transporter [Pullulanibacillus camelliae]